MNSRQEEFVSKIPDKPVEEYTESEVKEMFVELFFWITHNRPDWLQECIERKKAMIRAQKWKNRIEHRSQGGYRLFPQE